MPRHDPYAAFAAAHDLKCGLAGVAFLMEDILSDMRGQHSITDRMESVCALMTLVQGSATALVDLCTDSNKGGIDGETKQTPGA